MQFQSKYKFREEINSESGNNIAPVYSIATTENGSLALQVTGEINLYQRIQSHSDSVDLKQIIARYEATGDSSFLSKRQGQYIDITDMPTNFADVMKTVITAENQFNELPIEVRKAYNFSASEYIADIGSDKWLNLMKKPEKEQEKQLEKQEDKEDNSNES